MLYRVEEEVARVVVGQGDEWVAVDMLPADVDVHNGEEFLTVAVEEDDCC